MGWPALIARVSQPVLPLTLSASLLGSRSLPRADSGSWACSRGRCFAAGPRGSQLAMGCSPVRPLAPHCLCLAFSDFARTGFQDVRSTVLTAEETF